MSKVKGKQLVFQDILALRYVEVRGFKNSLCQIQLYMCAAGALNNRGHRLFQSLQVHSAALG